MKLLAEHCEKISFIVTISNTHAASNHANIRIMFVLFQLSNLKSWIDREMEQFLIVFIMFWIPGNYLITCYYQQWWECTFSSWYHHKFSCCHDYVHSLTDYCILCPVVTSFDHIDKALMMTSTDILTRKEKFELVSEI